MAVPHNGGWRYQVKSDDVPDDRCTLDITAAGEGFVMHTVEGARCVSYGGYSAYELLMQAEFPARSTVQGVVPELDGDGRMLDFDCGEQTFVKSAR